jgi:hypothetical protein
LWLTRTVRFLTWISTRTPRSNPVCSDSPQSTTSRVNLKSVRIIQKTLDSFQLAQCQREPKNLLWKNRNQRASRMRCKKSTLLEWPQPVLCKSTMLKMLQHQNLKPKVRSNRLLKRVIILSVRGTTNQVTTTSMVQSP